MNWVQRSLFAVPLALLLGCQPPTRAVLTEADREKIQQEVTMQFHQLVAALNRMDLTAWADFYSNDAFASAIIRTDHFAMRDAWVSAITKYFALRARQEVTPRAVRVTPLAPGLALMTSEEKTAMWLKDGTHAASIHVFTMVWKRESGGWKVVHSHESWVDEPAPDYCFTKVIGAGYDETLVRVQEELKKEDFGIITEIDVKETLKKKLNVDFRRYRILGACNPAFAHQALQVEPRIGALLPCNVIVQELEDGRVEVSAINPLESMKTVGNPGVAPIGRQVAAKLKAVIERL